MALHLRCWAELIKGDETMQVNCRSRLCVVFAVLLLMAGCASVPPEPTVNLPHDHWRSATEQKVAVVVAGKVQPQMHLPGASCLLCVGVAMAANKEVIEWVKGLDSSELQELDEKIADYLASFGVDASRFALTELPLLEKSDTSDYSVLAFRARHPRA